MRLSLDQLAADLEAFRANRGTRERIEATRRRLNSIDPDLRRQRHVARLRQAQIQHQVRTGCTGKPAAELKRALDACGRELAALDGRILKAIAALPDGDSGAPITQELPADPIVALEARAAIRGRLIIAASLIDGLLPRKVVSALHARIRRLEA